MNQDNQDSQDKEQDDFWAAIDRLEGSAKNSHDHLRRLFLLSTQQKIAIEQLDHKVDSYQQENRERFDLQDKEFREFRHETSERFDKIEDTLAIIVNHLKK